MGVEPGGELLQALAGSSLQVLGQPQLPAGAQQGHAPLPGIAGQLLQGIGPDLAARGVDDAQKGGVILGVGEEAHVGHDILDLGPGEEGGAAAEKVGDIVFAQGLLKEPRLMIAAIEDGKVTVVGLVGKAPVQDLGDHALGLVGLVATGDDPGALPFAVITPEAFLEEVGVMGDEGIGEAENAPA